MEKQDSKPNETKESILSKVDYVEKRCDLMLRLLLNCAKLYDASKGYNYN